MEEQQLATETSLSWCGFEAALERVEKDGSMTVLAIHKEDRHVAPELWRTMQPAEWVWKIDPKLLRGAWYVENNTSRVWGSRGD